MLNESVSIDQNLKSNIQNRILFLFILMLMSTAGLVGSDVYLPVLPEIAQALNKDSTAMQFTLGIYLFGLAVGQLFFGPLTDRFGRKKLLIIGMSIYFLASVSCAFSISYEQMITSRFLQAIGACSGLTIGRAIVGDLFDAKKSAKVFATIFPFVGMSPAISPLIGGFIGYYLGWPSTFLFISLFAMSVAILVFFYLPETLVKDKQQPLHLKKVLTAYPKLLINRNFIKYVCAPCIAYIAYFAYIAQSPFIFNAQGFGERAIGSFYITLALSYVAGNLTGRRLLNSYELDKVLYWGYLLFNAGSFLLLATGLLNLPLWLAVFSISILTFGNGFLIPLGIAGVISSSGELRGYASGLLGFLQLGVAALTSSLIGTISQNSLLYLSLYIVFFTLLGLFLFRYFTRSTSTQGA